MFVRIDPEEYELRVEAAGLEVAELEQEIREMEARGEDTARTALKLDGRVWRCGWRNCNFAGRIFPCLSMPA